MGGAMKKGVSDEVARRPNRNLASRIAKSGCSAPFPLYHALEKKKLKTPKGGYLKGLTLTAYSPSSAWVSCLSPLSVDRLPAYNSHVTPTLFDLDTLVDMQPIGETL